MNRATRRADLRSFKRTVHKSHLLTYMVEANDVVALDGLLARAMSFWRDGIEQRRPFCPVKACRANFADGAHPGAFLLSVPALAPTSASVTAICTNCWRDLPPVDIERAAAKVLRQLIPGGKFLDARR